MKEEEKEVQLELTPEEYALNFHSHLITFGEFNQDNYDKFVVEVNSSRHIYQKTLILDSLGGNPGFIKDKNILGSYIKNMFRFHTQRPKGDSKGFTLVTEIYWCERDIIVVGGVKYVHKLQNLYFTLAGKELTIK